MKDASMCRITRQPLLLLAGVLCLCAQSGMGAEPAVSLNTDGYDPSCGIEIAQQDSLVRVTWALGEGRRGRLTFDLAAGAPLIASAAVSHNATSPFQSVARALDPMLLLRVGQRDLRLRSGWTVFFDRMQRKPHEAFIAEIRRTAAVASSVARRATLAVGSLSAGPFQGRWRWTFYADNPFVLQEAILDTEEDAVAYLYDAGLACREALPDQIAWHDSSGAPQAESAGAINEPRHVAVQGRSVAAQFASGSIALFPPPHRYFYPLDFSDNLRNIWVGPGYDARPLPFGFGIRHDPSGDNRFVPWFNAPPGTSQQLGMFLLMSTAAAEETLQEVAQLTRNDRFAPLPGHTVFTSHYHVEHTQEVLNAQSAADANAASSVTGRLPSGGQYRIPERLQRPGFVRAFRDMGVDIVHLAEFHFGRTPRMTTQERVEHLELLHAECRRLSDGSFLLLPGEEPNVHLGGHWISFFPHPVYWVLNRPEGTPLVTQDLQRGRIYHVGSEADVHQLLRAERGLAWTAHPRIKGSTGFPDRYRERLFFQSDRFLGAAWKAMPADLSLPRLGTRVLDLLDDMSNWGDPKYVVGEVDVFKIEPDHELYGHMNVNYLRLDSIPRFEEGWESVLDALRGGRFFVTTGEVLLADFTVAGARSGETLSVAPNTTSTIELDVRWTFPLAYVEIVSGDGRETRRRRVDLSGTGSFGRETLQVDVDLAGQRWVRAEVWDIATSGAFTQPVWLVE